MRRAVHKAVLLLGLSGLLWCRLAHVRPRAHPVVVMKATAYAQARQATASGTIPHTGTVAADPNVLPLGTRIRILGDAAYAGTYLVTDTGSLVKGRHIDIFIPSLRRAIRFGAKFVRVEILEMGKGVEDARLKDTRGPQP